MRWCALRVLIVSSLAIAGLLLAQPAFADYFADDFNRPDSASAGNGWTNCVGNVGGNLGIVNNQLAPSAADGQAGVYRPFGLDTPVTISATLYEMNGFGGAGGRYDAYFAMRSNGSLGSGYGLNFARGDSRYNDSRIALFQGTTLLEILNPTFQYGESFNTSFTINPDGSVSGTVWQGTDSYPFTFGPRSISNSGGNFAFSTYLADSHGTVIHPRLDNLTIVPEPAGLGVLAVLAFLFRRQRRDAAL